MNASMVAIVAELLLKYGPGVAMGIVELFHAKEPTLEDWRKVFALAEQPYEEYLKGPTADSGS